MTVLILAQDCDAPVDRVVWELSKREVPVFRADTSWFPQRLGLGAELRNGRWCGQLRTQHRAVDLGDVRSIWYRDPGPFQFPDGMTDVEREHAHKEARLGLGGVLAALPVLWVNHPNRAADAMYKPLQLVTAARCGLSTPATLITNNPRAVTHFVRRTPEGTVHKTLGPNSFIENDKFRVAYTRRLSRDDLTDLRGIDVTAHQLQQWIEKSYEARVVTVGQRVFTIAIYANSADARIDWRADFRALSYEVIDPPPAVQTGVTTYLKTLGLAFAAFDFAIDQSGNWWFLESNSSGQYGWLEDATGAPISQAIADLLTEGQCA